MDLQYWRFMERTHPVYERPPEAEAWEFARPLPVRGGWALHADPYREAEEEEAAGLIEEPLHMSIEGMPALDWYQNAAGHTVLTLRLFSAYAEDMDLTEIVAAARAMFDDFKAHSRGPLDRADLARLGHPYGYGEPGAPTWARLQTPRKVPRYAVSGTQMRRVSLGHVRGIRGSVPTMSVVNRDTGEFERDWRWTYTVSGVGITLTFWNERLSGAGAPVAWFLLHGTIWMQAHGPWSVVPVRHWPALVQAWRAAALRAALARRRDEGVYGTEAI